MLSTEMGHFSLLDNRAKKSQTGKRHLKAITWASKITQLV